MERGEVKFYTIMEFLEICRLPHSLLAELSRYLGEIYLT